jgi:hypothetical protein
MHYVNVICLKLNVFVDIYIHVYVSPFALVYSHLCVIYYNNNLEIFTEVDFDVIM